MVREMWANVTSGLALKNPSLLNAFVIFAYADLKKHTFIYWFGFPALTGGGTPTASAARPLSDVYSNEQLHQLAATAKALPNETSAFFVVTEDGGTTLTSAGLDDWNKAVKTSAGIRPVLAYADASGLAENPGWTMRSLMVLLSYAHGKGRPLEITVIALRWGGGDSGLSGSIVMDVTVSFNLMYMLVDCYFGTEYHSFMHWVTY